MQIHELNNFTGTLGAGAYLAIDDGTDTGKISSQGLLAATEARIDNIIAGPAPSAQEVTDARLGADGVTYSSLGTSIRSQVTDLKSASTQLEFGKTYTVSGSVASPSTYVYNVAIPKGYRCGIKNTGSAQMTVKVFSENETVSISQGLSSGSYIEFYCPINAAGLRTYIGGTSFSYELTVLSVMKTDIDALTYATENVAIIERAEYSDIITGSWGGYNIPGSDTVRLRWTQQPHVKKGDIFHFDGDGLYVSYSVWDTDGTRLYLMSWTTGLVENEIPADGILQVMFANGATYDTSTRISPMDYTAETYVAKKGEWLTSLASQESLDNVEEYLNEANKAVVNGLNGNTEITINETVTANTSYTFDINIPKGSVVQFKNLEGSSQITINVSDGTTEQNVNAGLGAEDSFEFTAPFDIVRIRSYVGGTTYKVNVSWEFNEIKNIEDFLYLNNKSYFEAEIDDTFAKLIDATQNKSIVFAIVTDSHNYFDGWDNWSNTAKNLYLLNRAFPLDFVAHLGDIIEGNQDKDSSETYLSEVVTDLRRANQNVVTLTGNHEDNHPYYNINGTGLINDAERYSLLNRYNDANVQRIGTEQYFYFDFPNENMPIRIICLNGFLGDGHLGNDGNSWGYTDDEVAWVRDVALQTNKQVLFLSHMPLSKIYIRTYELGYELHNSDALKAVIGQFINNGGIVIGFFCGHTHKDFMVQNDLGVYEVQTGCQNAHQNGTPGSYSYNDGLYTPTAPTRRAGTAEEELWDVVVVSPVEGRVEIIRFGAGNDRGFTY